MAKDKPFFGTILQVLCYCLLMNYDVLSFFQYSLSLIVAFIFAFLVASMYGVGVSPWLLFGDKLPAPEESYLTPKGFKQCLRWTCKPNGLAKVLLHPAHVRESSFSSSVPCLTFFDSVLGIA